MKKIIQILICCFLTTTINSQSTTGIKSLTKIDSLEGIYFDIVTNAGDEISLKVSNYMDSAYSVFADENYCLVISRIYDQKSCFVSAAYKKDSIWIQDYENKPPGFFDTGVSTTYLKKATILDGTTLQVEYDFWFLGREEQLIRTKVSLYAYEFYNHHSGTSTSVFFINDKKQQQESPRKGPIWEYKNKNK